MSTQIVNRGPAQVVPYPVAAASLQVRILPADPEPDVVSRDSARSRKHPSQRNSKVAKRTQKSQTLPERKKTNASGIRTRKASAVQRTPFTAKDAQLISTAPEIATSVGRNIGAPLPTSELSILPAADANEATEIVELTTAANHEPAAQARVEPPTVSVDAVTIVATNEMAEARSESLPPGLITQKSMSEPGFLLRVVMQGWKWVQNKFKSHQTRKRLRVCESVSLGEKRFIAVIQVDGEQLLVGGSSNSIAMLAHLGRKPEFSELLRGHCEQDSGQA